MQKVLIAEDDLVGQQLLATTLAKWGYAVVITEDGLEAYQHLTAEDPPRIAILDWIMPGLTGPEICRKLRAKFHQPYTYLILLTANDSIEDITQGLEAGADDYIPKPYNNQELRARILAGERIISLERALKGKVNELEQALAQVHQLKQLLPICMFCKKIRDDNDYWQQIETYIHERTGADFSHGICPECYQDWREKTDGLHNSAPKI